MKLSFRTNIAARGLLAFLTFSTCALAEETHFKVKISGGILDGKTFTGKVAEEETSFLVGLQSEEESSGLFFKRVKVSEDPLHATLRINWKGSATDGIKKANLDDGLKLSLIHI